MNTRWLSSCALTLCVGTVSACSAGADAARIDVERTDSAGLEIVVSSAEDLRLPWTLDPVLRIGADEGPAAFGGLYGNSVDVDAQGRIVVLDAAAKQVVVFDRNGTHVGTFGRKGGGPGEMEFPNAIAADENSVINVYDFSKPGTLRFAADGTVLEQMRLPPLHGIKIGVAQGRTWGVFADRSEFGEPATLRLLGIAGDTTELLRHQEQGSKPVEFKNCTVVVTLPPLLSPDLHFDNAGTRVAYGVGSAYAVTIFENGRAVRSVRRAVPPERVTPELAEREVGDSMRITFGSGACAIPPRDVVEARGTAEVMPAMRDIALAPDGSLWIARGVGPREAWRIDVFDAHGAYNGTLPEGTPLPAAFRGTDEIVVIEKDELDRQSVVVYRIRR